MFERRPSDSRIDLSGLRIRSGFSAGAVIVPTYAAVLRDTYLASEVWPLVNISAGTTISAFINSARNGTETGWVLQSAAGPVTGTLAPLSDGTTSDYGNIYTSGGGVGLADIFNGAEGWMFGFGRVSSAGVWTDGAIRTIIRLRADANNEIALRKAAGSNRFDFRYVSGGVTKLPFATLSPTTFFSVGMSWSDAADEMKAYLDGAQVGATQTGLGTWAGTLNATFAAIGSQAVPPSVAAVWSGLLAYVAVGFGSILTPAQFAAMHSAASTAGPDV